MRWAGSPIAARPAVVQPYFLLRKKIIQRNFPAMRLANYLDTYNIKRVAAAEALGVSPARITFLCSDEGWPATRDLAEKIRTYTEGEVRPDDFLPPSPYPRPAPEVQAYE
jgi:hypothetical protein